MPVANNLPKAPRKKASVGANLDFRRLSIIFFNCSKIVYCRIGFMTRTRAGITPANKAPKPSFSMSCLTVDHVVGTAAGLDDAVSVDGSSTSRLRAVIRVLTTQIGFVIKTVADPGYNN